MAKSISMGTVVSGVFSTFVVGIGFFFSLNLKKKKTEEQPVKPVEFRITTFQNPSVNSVKDKLLQSNQRNYPTMIRVPKLIE